MTLRQLRTKCVARPCHLSRALLPERLLSKYFILLDTAYQKIMYQRRPGFTLRKSAWKDKSQDKPSRTLPWKCPQRRRGSSMNQMPTLIHVWIGTVPTSCPTPGARVATCKIDARTRVSIERADVRGIDSSPYGLLVIVLGRVNYPYILILHYLQAAPRRLCNLAR